MVSSPAISVVVAAYNAEPFIRVCINSIIDQSFRDFELICIDDGSTDNTLQILTEYAEANDYITVYSQDNRGAGAARNLGLQHASGTYIIFLDADDFFDSTMLDTLYTLAVIDNLDMVVCQAFEYDNKTEKTNKVLDWAAQSKSFSKSVFSYKDNPGYIFQAINTWAWNKLIRKSIVDKYNLKFQELMSSNDNLFVTDALVLCERISIINKPLIFYRVNNPNSLQRSKHKTWYCSCESAYAVKEDLIKFGIYDDVECSFINKSLKNVMYYYNTINGPEKEKLAQIIKGEFTQKLSLDKFSDDYFYDEKLLKQYRWIQNKIFFPVSKAIPIILASDNNYARQMYVTIKSILESKNESTVIDFYLLLHTNFSERYIRDIKRMINSYLNTRVNFVVMSDKFEKLHLEISHISSPTYYRLDMANILPQEYDRCIYLDTDIIVTKDLFDYFSVDLNDYYAAGVKAASYIMNRSNLGYLKSIGIKDVDKYINAGAVIYNLKKIREENTTSTFYELARNNYHSQDQDVINIAFKGNVKIIPLWFNMMTKYKSFEDKNLPEYSRIVKVYPESEIRLALFDPVIIHYAGSDKPWNVKSGLFVDRWWDVANKCPYKKYSTRKKRFKEYVLGAYHTIDSFISRPSKREMLNDLENKIDKLQETVNNLSKQPKK